MTPELITKLKEAKFPFTYEGLKGEWGGAMHPPEDYVPTLSELIKACGEDFMLTNECGRWGAWSKSKVGVVRMGEAGAEFECEGSTPEEAVACLYLSLHHHD